MHGIDGFEEEVMPGQLHWISPSQVHGFRPAARSGFRLVNVALTAATVEAFLHRHEEAVEVLSGWQLQQHRTEQLVQGQIDGFTRLVNGLSDGGRGVLDAEYFLCALTRLLRRSGHGMEVSGGPEWLRMALPVAVEPEHLREGFGALVKLCGRTPEHVSRTFRQHLGKTPSDWINEKRVERARLLLETDEASIQETAFETGFDNLSHFHRVFKAATGVTPLRYRRARQSALF